MAKSNAFAKMLKAEHWKKFTVRDMDNNDCGQFDTMKEATEFVREQLEENIEDGYTLFIDKIVLIGKVRKPDPKASINIVVDPKE